MLIPKKIKIGKQYYYVRVEPTHRAAQLGYVQYGNRLIVINDKSAKKPRKPAEMNETFWHEITHAILHEMDEKRLAFDERFVKQFGMLLSKAIDSARF